MVMFIKRFGPCPRLPSTPLSGVIASVVIPLIVAIVLLAGCASRQPAAKFLIDNPYQHVDGTRDRQYKANLHTHTNRSDGREEPAKVIDLYREQGYSVLTITDHDILGPNGGEKDPKRQQTTWPWQVFGRDPQALDMVAIEGNEITRTHHIGSYFNDYGDADVKSEHQALKKLVTGRDWRCFSTLVVTESQWGGMCVFSNASTTWSASKSTTRAIVTRRIAKPGIRF